MAQLEADNQKLRDNIFDNKYFTNFPSYHHFSMKYKYGVSNKNKSNLVEVLLLSCDIQIKTENNKLIDGLLLI